LIAGSFDLSLVLVCVQSGRTEKEDMVQMKDVFSEFPKFKDSLLFICQSHFIVHDHQGLSSSRPSMPPARHIEGVTGLPCPCITSTGVDHFGSTST